MDPRQQWREIVFSLRKALGLDQRSFAAKIGKSQGAIQGWEKKGSPNLPSLDSVEAIAEARGQLPEELVAEIYGRRWRGVGDRTWPEVGEAMSDREFEELCSNVDNEKAARWVMILTRILLERAKG